MTLKNFVVFLGEAQPQKSRLSERGTSEFRDFGGASLRKTRNYSPERKNKTIYSPYYSYYAEQFCLFYCTDSAPSGVSGTVSGRLNCMHTSEIDINLIPHIDTAAAFHYLMCLLAVTRLYLKH